MLLFWNSNALSLLQLPMHPFLLLVSFNAFSHSVHASLVTAGVWWGKILIFSGPLFIALEGLSSLLVVQKLGQEGRRLTRETEEYQFGLLIATAVAYVTSAWWIVVVSHSYQNSSLSQVKFVISQSYPSAASTPLSSTLLGVAMTAFVFLTFIGFVLRRTNIIESSGLALFIAYNVWLCGFDQKSFSDPSSS